MTFRTPIKSDLYSRTFVKLGKQRVEKVFKRLTTVNWVCPIYALWKSMKYDRSLYTPWAYSPSSPVTLRPPLDNSAFDIKRLILYDKSQITLAVYPSINKVLIFLFNMITIIETVNKVTRSFCPTI